MYNSVDAFALKYIPVFDSYENMKMLQSLEL